MIKDSIILIEDEEDISELIEFTLNKEGYQVSCFSSGEKGLEKIKRLKPDLILLDLMLPGMSGLEICKEVKQDPKTKHIPVIMVTARDEDMDVVVGLELGADDYVSKPFSPRILAARVRSVLRRYKKLASQPSDQEIITIHDIQIHKGRHEVLVYKKPVKLSNTEFKILFFLSQKPGWVFTRQQIVDHVSGEDYPVTERSVDVQIVGIRKKLGKLGSLIETVRGVGYRLKE